MQKGSKKCLFAIIFCTLIASCAVYFIDTKYLINLPNPVITFSKIAEQPSNNTAVFDEFEDIETIYPFKLPKFAEDQEKAQIIKNEFLFAWRNYEKYCWGNDEIYASSTKCYNTLHAGLTIIDSLSTLWIMDLKDEFKKARDFVEKDFKPNGQWNTFEFIIRFVGGFLSAYELSGDKLFLDKAILCADAVCNSMTSSGYPNSNIRITTSPDGKLDFNIRSGYTNIAMVSSFQIEFARLTAITGDPKYLEYGIKCYQTIWGHNPGKALVGPSGHQGGGQGKVSLGADVDSYYEYITKLYIMTNGQSKKLLDRHVMMMDEIKSQLIYVTKPHNMTIISERIGNRRTGRVDHLSTFAGGLVTIGAVKENPNWAEDLRLGGELARSYYMTYTQTRSGIGPEAANFDLSIGPDAKRDFTIADATYQLRPESIESVYIAYKFTGLPRYREYVWEMIQNVLKGCRLSNGFGKLSNVDMENPTPNGNMESFFLAETLKYAYLTFCSSDVLPPTKWVFNSEAHPLRIFTEEETKRVADILAKL